MELFMLMNPELKIQEFLKDYLLKGKKINNKNNNIFYNKNLDYNK